MRNAIGIGVVLWLLVSPVEAQQRVDLFDRHGNRQGYAVVDPKGERVDVFDRKGNRQGYGVMGPDRADWFTRDGLRSGSSPVPKGEPPTGTRGRR